MPTPPDHPLQSQIRELRKNLATTTKHAQLVCRRCPVTWEMPREFYSPSDSLGETAIVNLLEFVTKLTVHLTTAHKLHVCSCGGAFSNVGGVRKCNTSETCKNSTQKKEFEKIGYRVVAFAPAMLNDTKYNDLVSRFKNTFEVKELPVPTFMFGRWFVPNHIADRLDFLHYKAHRSTQDWELNAEYTGYGAKGNPKKEAYIADLEVLINTINEDWNLVLAMFELREKQ